MEETEMISDERQQSSVHLYESRLQQAAVYRNSFITQRLFAFFSFIFMLHLHIF